MYKSRLQERYEKQIRDKLKAQYSYANVFEIPRLVKIVVSQGIKEAVQNPKIIEKAATELLQITGQKPVVQKAKKSIATFKLRRGMEIGLKVTLRRHMMYEFLDRLVNIALPRVRDFRGLSPKQFDGMGNYSLGLKEQLVFPEIDYDKVDKVLGMNITIVTTAKTDAEAKTLLETFDLPFVRG
ncbi:50S ribosomal protein L5 [Rickettsiales endosymbiont of Peranema trichophorum]|uniref:50S ribosomal protein L5 n=1 Tax=Rickettsiales endosymbiont of Peranema trichophorum TaxID=2486577 RepID=UPI0010230279|nr:50S ribosomal protein L5 [Rickettsiales endosymbiont of Peranema trichophorum]RZI45570.1 50S ribosomal protein L5 [Rickettsiales endosymbiont of Peranema trichophorum]